MIEFLPLRANMEWLKKAAKDRLVSMRAARPDAQLSDAQLSIARGYGFPSWRAMSSHVEEVRDKLRAALPAPAILARPETAPIAAEDPDLVSLFEAINAADAPRFAALIERRPALATARAPDGLTPLHAAAEANDPRMGLTLLVYGADPQARYGDSAHTALSWAVTCRGFDFASFLVRLGVAPDLFTAAGMGALEHVLASFDDTGAIISGASTTGSTRYRGDGTRLPCPPTTPVELVSDALYIASRSGHADVVRFLLSRPHDIHFRAYMGGAALHWAHFGRSREVIELLLAHGADPGTRDDVLGCTPRAFGICAPASWGLAFLVDAALAADPSLATYMDGHTSALHVAAAHGQTEVVRTLLARGADPRQIDGAGRTAIRIAVDSNHPEAAAMMQGPP